MSSKKVVLATQKIEISNFFTLPTFVEKYELLKSIQNKDELIPWLTDFIKNEENSLDILILSEGIPSTSGITTQTLLLKVREKFPKLRIIFLAGQIDDDDYVKLQVLGNLVQSGIYDIYKSAKLGKMTLLELLENAGTKEKVGHYLTYLDVGRFPTQFKNTVVFSSIKPGTGKSFFAVNTAIGIAKFGKLKKDGQPLRVAIVEGDLLTLSVGTLLQIEDSKHNLRTALEAIKTIIDDDGIIFGTQDEVERVTAEVRRNFVRHSEFPNLYALVSSQLSLSDLFEINSYHYFFLIQCIVGAFDVVIVDTNSSLEHRSTAPLLELASKCYFLLDLDTNNIRNNIRYRRELEMLNIAHKIRYVLNRDLGLQNQGIEKLQYSADDLEEAGFKLSAKVPWIDVAIMYNRTRRGTPLILDRLPVLNRAREELLTIANEIWELEVPQDEFVVERSVKKQESSIEQKKTKKKPWWKFW